MKILLVVLLAMASSARAEVDGKLVLGSPSLGAWQSLDSADQAIGLKEDILLVHVNGQPLVVFGWQASVEKHMVSSVGDPVRFISGPTLAVPGSLLDWTLGTSWGQKWLPKAKVGLTAAPDVTRLNSIGFKNTFYGFGLTYPVGG